VRWAANAYCFQAVAYGQFPTISVWLFSMVVQHDPGIMTREPIGQGNITRGGGPQGSDLMFGWLRGKDLNLRPLGYEFNTWSWMGIFAMNGQQYTSTTYWLVLTVSGSRVSNLLALFAALPTGDAPDPGLSESVLAPSRPPSAESVAAYGDLGYKIVADVQQRLNI
jgi:hypothetical protein